MGFTVSDCGIWCQFFESVGGDGGCGSSDIPTHTNAPPIPHSVTTTHLTSSITTFIERTMNLCHSEHSFAIQMFVICVGLFIIVLVIIPILILLF